MMGDVIGGMHEQVILHNETYYRAVSIVKEFLRSTAVALPKLAVPRTEAIGYTKGVH